MTDFAQKFIIQSSHYLTRDYLPKIRLALEKIDDETTWWRPNEESNSIGHLLLHLAGNIRQWIGSGLGGAPDTREREREFAPASRPGTAALMENLAAAVTEVAEVLERLDPAVLEQRHLIQGNDVTGFEALYHVVEHFSMHTGQILYIVKMHTGSGLGFYQVDEGVAKRMWE